MRNAAALPDFTGTTPNRFAIGRKWPDATLSTGDRFPVLADRIRTRGLHLRRLRSKLKTKSLSRRRRRRTLLPATPENSLFVVSFETLESVENSFESMETEVRRLEGLEAFETLETFPI